MQQDFDAPGLTAQSGTHLLNWVASEIYADSCGGTRAEWAARFDAKARERAADLPARADFEQPQLCVALVLEKLGALPPGDVALAMHRGAAGNLAVPSALSHPLVRAMKTGSFDATAAQGFAGRIAAFLQGQPALSGGAARLDGAVGRIAGARAAAGLWLAFGAIRA